MHCLEIIRGPTVLSVCTHLVQQNGFSRLYLYIYITGDVKSLHVISWVFTVGYPIMI